MPEAGKKIDTQKGGTMNTDHWGGMQYRLSRCDSLTKESYNTDCRCNRRTQQPEPQGATHRPSGAGKIGQGFRDRCDRGSSYRFKDSKTLAAVGGGGGACAMNMAVTVHLVRVIDTFTHRPLPVRKPDPTPALKLGVLTCVVPAPPKGG